MKQRVIINFAAIKKSQKELKNKIPRAKLMKVTVDHWAISIK